MRSTEPKQRGDEEKGEDDQGDMFLLLKTPLFLLFLEAGEGFGRLFVSIIRHWWEEWADFFAQVSKFWVLLSGGGGVEGDGRFNILLGDKIPEKANPAE